MNLLGTGAVSGTGGEELNSTVCRISDGRRPKYRLDWKAANDFTLLQVRPGLWRFATQLFPWNCCTSVQVLLTS